MTRSFDRACLSRCWSAVSRNMFSEPAGAGHTGHRGQMVLETVLASLFAGRPGALISLKPGAGEFFNRLFGLNRFDRVRDSRNIVMSNDQDVIPDLLCRAVNCVLRGEPRAARSLIASIDQSALVADRKSALRRRRSKLASAFLEDRPRRNREDSNGWAARGQPRMTVPRSAMLAIFQRDHFVCRYQHCRRRTVYVPVLRALSALFPDLIPYQKNWRPLRITFFTGRTVPASSTSSLSRMAEPPIPAI